MNLRLLLRLLLHLRLWEIRDLRRRPRLWAHQDLVRVAALYLPMERNSASVGVVGKSGIVLGLVRLLSGRSTSRLVERPMVEDDRQRAIAEDGSGN